MVIYTSLHLCMNSLKGRRKEWTRERLEGSGVFISLSDWKFGGTDLLTTSRVYGVPLDLYLSPN